MTRTHNHGSWKQHWRAILLVAVIGAGVAAYFLTGLKSSIQPANLVHLKAHVLGAGWQGAVVYVLIYIAFVSLGLPNLPFQLAAGAIYGLWQAYGLMYLGMILGASGAFWLARLLGRHSVERFAGRKLKGFNDKVANNGFTYLLVLRMIPLVPFNAINYGSGLSRMPFARYFVATILGSPALTFAHVAFGHAAGHVDWTDFHTWLEPQVYVPLGSSLILVGLSLTLARWIRHSRRQQ